MSKRIDLIQVMRAAAAMLVVFGHSQTTVASLSKLAGVSFVRCRLLPWGAGVDLFFVISGFIMVYASRNLFGSSAGRLVFVRRRVSRVAPLYWACLTIYITIVMWAHLKGAPLMFSLQAITASFLFIPYPSLGPAAGLFPVLDLGWTLNYEMFFYALFAAVIVLPQRRAIPVVLGLLLLLVGAGAVFKPGAPASFWTQPIILDFALGVLVAHLRCEGVRWPRILRLGMAALCLVVFALDPLKLFSQPLGVTTPNGLARVLTSGLPAAGVLAAAVFGGDVLWPQLRPAVALGNASYSLYLSHPFVLIALEKLATKTHLISRVGPWPLVIVAVPVAAAVSLVVFHGVEEPLTRAASRLGRQLNATSARRREGDPLRSDPPGGPPLTGKPKTTS